MATPPPETKESPEGLADVYIHYPPNLPISARVDDILVALGSHQVVIVAGATGSGKTTQLPKIAWQFHERRLQAARTAGETEGALPRRPGPPTRSHSSAQARPPTLIGITQPRRIAATSVAQRVAEEVRTPLGAVVGYQIRFDNKTSADTQLKFMTDGILLAEIQTDPRLSRYHTLIIDEAHERGLTIDFLLGWLKTILARRPELKVIVSSATIETSRFSGFFDNAPIIEVEGRTFPVEVLYEPPEGDTDVGEAAADAVENIASLDPDGDFLVFLPGEREIRDAERALLAKSLRGVEVLPLYSRLSAAEQNRVFSPQSKRRVILATNVAETSLTLPGIVYVVDTGLARLSRYEPRSGITRLPIERISQASADQRKGRAGRVREGLCVRLYSEEDFANRPGFTDPEIRRVGLAGVILRMKSLKLGSVEAFPFLDPPDVHAITEGYRTLTELGALTKERELTALGKQLARFPVDPRVGRMILAGAEYGVLDDVLVLAAALEVQDPRERPRGEESRADQKHRAFRDETSDFIGLLKLWAFLVQAGRKGSSQVRRACKEHYLSYRRVREWREVHRQLTTSARELKLRSSQQPALGFDEGARIHCALLSGLLSRIGQYAPEKRAYTGARQTRFVLHPSSVLAKKPPAWVLAFELVQTTQLFARTCAKLDPEWVSAVADHLLKRSYSDPSWSEKSGRAVVREHATLFGLAVLNDRRVDYATIAPARARLLFLEHALVRGEYKSPGAFQAHNRALLEQVAALRSKARRSDMLSDDEALLSFFDARVAESVVSGKTFEAWRRDAEKAAPEHLHLTLDDVLQRTEALLPADYPDVLSIDGMELQLEYRFEPTAEDDGVTALVPLALAPRLDPAVLEWTIPAWHEQQLLELLQRVPKSVRRELGSPTALQALAATLAAKLPPFSGPLRQRLGEAILELSGVQLPAGALRPDLLPAHLRLNCRILGAAGKPLGESRELDALFEQYGAQARASLRREQPTAAWQQRRTQRWDFGALPESVEGEVLGSKVPLYPALLDRGDAVELLALPSRKEARRATSHGVKRLAALALAQELKALGKRVPKSLLPLTVTASPLGPSRKELNAFHQQLLDRVVWEACLREAPALPAREAEFAPLVATGKTRLDQALVSVLHVVNSVNNELIPTRLALEQAAKGPSASAAVRDMLDQLRELLPDALLLDCDLAQLAAYPRYLQGIRLRLGRALNAPPKDADKLRPLLPLWQALVARREALEPEPYERLRWAFEELRIATFAPELKPAYPISVEKFRAMLQALG